MLSNCFCSPILSHSSLYCQSALPVFKVLLQGKYSNRSRALIGLPGSHVYLWLHTKCSSGVDPDWTASGRKSASWGVASNVVFLLQITFEFDEEIAFQNGKLRD